MNTPAENMQNEIQGEIQTWLNNCWPNQHEKWLQGEEIPHADVVQSFINYFVADRPANHLPEYLLHLSHWPFLQLSRTIAKATCEQTTIKNISIQSQTLSTLIHAAVDLGFARYVFNATLAEVRQRQTFGMALIRNQHVEFNLAELQATIFAFEAWWELTNENRDQLCTHESFTQLSNPLLKKLADQYLQFSGGRGYMQGHPAERVFREVFLED
ncbi:MAG TPA: acyl-CoA dehydrogenase family protein [Cellvibrio sp.]|nr:acyl-CoA dehydrogenase family protein [Cellvibrio sp.]